MDVSYSLVPKEELPAAIEIELAGYHPDEAASLSKFEHRQAQAPDLFLGAYIEQNPPSADAPNPLSTRKLIGYVVATISANDAFTHDSMESHVPTSSGGTSVCIHSVCVHPQWRRKGVALGLLREYLKRLEAGDPLLQRVLLICHDDMVPLYEKAGFAIMGKSPVVHGPREWLEMKYDLHRSPSGTQSDLAQAVLTPDLLAALSKAPSQPRPTVKRLVSFASIQEVVTNDPESGSQLNKFKLFCPREGCGSLILLTGVAKLVEAASIQIDSPDDPPPVSILSPLPSPPDTMEWWLITPNPMQFENIGFSKAVQGAGAAGQRIKFLSCAECDLGPLGWCYEGGHEFWLACSRVAYRE